MLQPGTGVRNVENVFFCVGLLFVVSDRAVTHMELSHWLGGAGWSTLELVLLLGCV